MKLVINILLSLLLCGCMDNQVQALTPFSTEYKATYKLGWFSLDIKGVRTLEALEDNRWVLTFDASTTGASLSEKSTFRIEKGQIIPEEYRYQTGGLLTKQSQHQRFDAKSKTIEDLIHNKRYTNIWRLGVQDNLTYILQASLDLAAEKTDLHYEFFQQDKLKKYHYKVVGNEELSTNIGKLKTVKLERMDSGNRSIFAWFAIEHNYQLVRLAEYKKGKVAYEIDIAKL